MINIVTAGDLHVFSGVELLITSACHYAKEPIHFYILTGSLIFNNKEYQSLEKQKYYLEDIVESYQRGHQITFVDCSEIYLQELQVYEQHLNSGNPYCILRLLLDKLLPEIPIIYLDPDCIVLHDLQEYYNLVIKNYDICINDENNFCSGSMGFNLRQCNHDNFLFNARELYKTYFYNYPDQEAIKNTKGTISIYPTKYQVFPSSNTEVDFLNTYILHYTGSPEIYKLYFQEDVSTEQRQENLFGTDKITLEFLRAEIQEHRQKFNYQYMPGGFKELKFTDPNLIRYESKNKLKVLKNKLREL